MRRIDSGTSFAKLAVRLTAARQAEIRRANPDQFDLKAAVWTVPAASMKMSREHRVPLSRQAVDVVGAALKRNGSAYLFHGRDGGKLGTAAIAQALRRADIDATPHGFRTSFKDWARNHGVEHETSELCLAHVEGSKTVQAYARDDLLEKRRPVGFAGDTHPGRAPRHGRRYGARTGRTTSGTADSHGTPTPDGAARPPVRRAALPPGTGTRRRPSRG